MVLIFEKQINAPTLARYVLSLTKGCAASQGGPGRPGGKKKGGFRKHKPRNPPSGKRQIKQLPWRLA
jgi:hypothetical protein